MRGFWVQTLWPAEPKSRLLRYQGRRVTRRARGAGPRAIRQNSSGADGEGRRVRGVGVGVKMARGRKSMAVALSGWGSVLDMKAVQMPDVVGGGWVGVGGGSGDGRKSDSDSPRWELSSNISARKTLDRRPPPPTPPTAHLPPLPAFLLHFLSPRQRERERRGGTKKRQHFWVCQSVRSTGATAL